MNETASRHLLPADVLRHVQDGARALAEAADPARSVRYRQVYEAEVRFRVLEYLAFSSTSTRPFARPLVSCVR